MIFSSKEMEDYIVGGKIWIIFARIVLQHPWIIMNSKNHHFLLVEKTRGNKCVSSECWLLEENYHSTWYTKLYIYIYDTIQIEHMPINIHQHTWENKVCHFPTYYRKLLFSWSPPTKKPWDSFQLMFCFYQKINPNFILMTFTPETSFSHHHGFLWFNWPYLKGNCYGRDPVFTSMLGGRLTNNKPHRQSSLRGMWLITCWVEVRLQDESWAYLM